MLILAVLCKSALFLKFLMRFHLRNDARSERLTRKMALLKITLFLYKAAFFINFA